MQRFEHDNGILVRKELRTPAQKDDRGLWCPKCRTSYKEALVTCDSDFLEDDPRTGVIESA